MRIFAVALLLAAPCAVAQQSPPDPAHLCSMLATPRFENGPAHTAQPFTHELGAKSAEARAACEQVAITRPRDGWIQANLARMRAFEGDKAGALEAARAGAALRDRNAQALLGVMLAEGQGVARDYVAAREQFRLAAREGSLFGSFNHGVILANGWGTEADEADATAAFRQAAKKGDPFAMQVLGQRYDKANAEEWLRKAAELMMTEAVREPLRLADFGRAKLEVAPLLAWYEAKARGGEPWAQGYLGALYEAGQWVKQDNAAAALWYRQAGEAGHTLSQWRMAAFYREGRGGLPQDKAESNRWSMMWQVKRCDDHERAGAGVNACDRFAADGFDPQRAAAGVDSFCMVHFAPRAIPACTAAVKASPATVRFRTQLARSLAHTGRLDEARREATTAAAAGSTASMIMLGAMSQRGLGVEKNPAAALAWYRKAAEAGDERGISLVLNSVQTGVGVAKDSPEAKAISDAMWKRMTPKAAPTIAERAAAGHAASQFNLAAQFEREKKYDEALQWYTRAAAQGYGIAELNLAQMYEMGIGVKQDTAEARKRYRKLADAGDGEARWRAARLAAAGNEYEEALRLYNRSIRDDDYRAILDVGQMYEQGRGVKKDMRRAVELYERVGERSNWASAKLGILYLQGEGIPKDYDKARSSLQRAAGGGNASARNNLGVMYDRGLGVGVDYATAADLYLGALGSGNAQARGNLESLYAEGRGAPAGAAALEWYRRGADAGVAAAQYRLGRMYAKGDGVPRNDELAVQWLMKAAEQGHPEARKEAGDLLYAMGRDQEATALGHEGAARRLAAKFAAQGQPLSPADLNRYLADIRARLPPPPLYPEGVATNPGSDQSRELAVRVGGVGDAQKNAMNAATADPWDIIRWYPADEFKR